MSSNTNVWARGRRFYRFPAETPSGTKNDSAEAIGNTEKVGTVKKEVSPAVSLSLSVNPDWGDFEVDINHNTAPVAVACFSRFPAETPSGTKNDSAEAIGNIANGNTEKVGTVKKEVSPAVSLSLSVNPDWGDFEVDINHNTAPVAVASTPVIPQKLAESHPLPKKEVTTVSGKLEKSSSEESEKAGLQLEGVKNADQLLISKTKLVSVAVLLRSLADELLSLVGSA